MLFPPLRDGADHFARWYFAAGFWIGSKKLKGEYDIELPSEPQRVAIRAASINSSIALLAAGGATESEEDDNFDEDELDDDLEDLLEDD